VPFSVQHAGSRDGADKILARSNLYEHIGLGKFLGGFGQLWHIGENALAPPHGLGFKRRTEHLRADSDGTAWFSLIGVGGMILHVDHRRANAAFPTKPWVRMGHCSAFVGA
jgi:hypothetical protein